MGIPVYFWQSAAKPFPFRASTSGPAFRLLLSVASIWPVSLQSDLLAWRHLKCPLTVSWSRPFFEDPG